jgi:hypothetical protein
MDGDPADERRDKRLCHVHRWNRHHLVDFQCGHRQHRAFRHHGGSGGGRQPVMRRPAIIKRAPGLAAIKHQQQVAARGALSERYEKASSALASVQAAARAEWPKAMKREMQACRTTEQQRLWSEKWALHLAGRVVSEVAPERPWPCHLPWQIPLKKSGAR